MIADYHVHSAFSGDSQADLDLIIKQAIKLGMKDICITDHQDFDYPYEGLKFELDFKQYFSTLNVLKDTYADKININIGIEMGLEPFLVKQINSTITSYPFDFVIGSSHLVNRIDPYYPGFFEGRSDKECFIEYFEAILENLETINDFDVYGHIDYIVRYSPNKDANYSYSEFSLYIDKLLIKIIEMGKGIEINTGALRKGLTSTNPCLDVVRRYYELGGRIITVGSDAHYPEHVGADFNKAASILRCCGFKNYTIFRNRKPILLPLL